MAETVVPITALTAGTVVADVEGTAIDASKTVVITPTERLDKLIIRLVNTTAATKVMTVLAGDNPPADAAGQGALAISFADGSSTPVVKYLSGLESARYLQSDGTVQITFATSTTGFVTAFQLP